MAAVCLSTEIERLLSHCVVDESLDEIRRYAYVRTIVKKLSQLEAVGGESVLNLVIEYEEQLLSLVNKIEAKDQDINVPQGPETVRLAPHASEEENENRDAINSELQEMTAALKESSLNMHRKLTSQQAILDTLDESTQANLDGIKSGRTALESYRSKTTRRFFASLGSIFGVGISFAFTYILIRTFPKSYTT